MEKIELNTNIKSLIQTSLSKAYRQADKFNEILLALYFLFGVGIASFYDTWVFALAVGPIALAFYCFPKWIMPNTKLRQYTIGITYGIFMAQFIYQMHGLFEMHFTVFVASVALISYRNWKAFIPFTLFVVAHHAVFAYLQYSGFPEIRFTQDEYMPLTTFIIHLSLAALIIGLSAYRAYDFKSFTLSVVEKEAQLAVEAERAQSNIGIATDIAAGKPVQQTVAEDDELGRVLMNMQSQLSEAQKREKVEKFVNVGLAEIGELLRKYNDSLEELSESIIGYLVKYLEANQGAIYILKEQEAHATENEVLEMKGCYAYGKKKHLNTQVEAGQGLVGQVYKEQETMILTDVPDQYLKITSGLGEETASYLIFVPLKINDQVEGVIEVASFNVLEDYQVLLLEKISESIASAISNGKVSERTRLLLEQSKQQTEELRAQEEEMRQNNEELQATQEEMIRKEGELSGFIDAIDNTFASIEFDTQGNVLKANGAFLKTMGYTSEEIVGQHHRIFVTKEYEKSAEYGEFWRNLSEGKPLRSDIQRVKKNGNKIWLYASYTPLLDQQGQVYKVLKLAQDITLRKNEEVEIKRLSLVANNTDNSVVITDKQGLVEYVNQGFERLTGYTLDDVRGKKPGSMLQGKDTDPETKKRIAQKLQKLQPFYEEILNYNKSGESYWISLAVNPVFDKNGELEKFIAIQANITETKSEAIDYACKMDAISRSNAIVEFSMDGKVLTANKIYTDSLGYEHEEINGVHHSVFVSKEVQESKKYKELWTKLRKGEGVQGDFERVTKSGDPIWFRGNFNVVRDINGVPFKIVKIAQDVTEVKKLELEANQHTKEIKENEKKLRKYTAELEELQGNLSDKLQEAKDEMKGQLSELKAEKLKNTAILEGCVDAVISFNDRGTVEFFNRAAEDMWGIESKKVLGRNINELVPVALVQVEDGSIQAEHHDESSDTRTLIKIRTEINFINKQEEEISALITCSKAEALGRNFYTFFAQKISVDLF